MVKFFRTLSIPQALVLLGLIAGVVAMWALTPAKLVDKLAEQSPETLAAGIVTIGIAVAGVFAQFRKAGPLLALLGVLALGGLTTGCMSAVRAHATTATIATVALASFGDGVERAGEAELATCEQAPDPDACITRVEHDLEVAAAAHDTVRPLVGAYRDGVETGAIAGDNASVVDALLVMGLRMLREWPSLSAAGRVFGVEAPVLTIPGAPTEGGAP